MAKVGPYTKKVIDYFKKPHNYGRMKNPDGVGKVGNPVCLTSNQKIHTNNNLKEINKISKEDRVLSHAGRYDNIDKIIERNYTGDILTIKNKLGTIDLTPDHLLMAIKIPKGDKFLRTKNRKELVPAWYHAGDLQNGDVILYPILKEEKNLDYLEINIPKPKWDFKSKEIPTKIPLSADLLRLFGYFLSEGSIQDKPSRTFISFILNINEKDIVKDINRISKKLFGLDTTVRKLPQKKTVVVDLFSARLARFFKNLFGTGADKKTIPDFIMNLSPRRQKPLIYSLWRGDGYLNLTRIGPRAGFSTTSYLLAQQMKTLLLRQKIIPSIYIDKAREANGVKHKKSYRIHIGQRDSLLRLCALLKRRYKPQSYLSEKGWFDKDFLYTAISGIKRKRYQGKVYNLEIKNSHSFTTEAFILHNCGDVMWLYIRVGRDKRGREIIKDIKFETFGCVAAIATSSAITDLAKGKTVEEAMKIDREEIVRSLGGLPPIKVHCSVLAAGALSEAIYDYLSKNKREIPEKLEKLHQRIEKEKKEINKKYKEWIKIEEKMYKRK